MKILLFFIMVYFAIISQSFPNPCLDVTWRNLPGLINPDSTMMDTCYNRAGDNISFREGKFYTKIVGIQFDSRYWPYNSNTITANQLLSINDFDSLNYPETYNAIKNLISFPNYTNGSLVNKFLQEKIKGPSIAIEFRLSTYTSFDSILIVLDTLNNRYYDFITYFPNGRVNLTNIDIDDKISLLYKQTQTELIIYNDISSFELFDILGNKMSSLELIGNSINIKNLPQGIYFLVLHNNDKQTTIKFIK